jgi:hypothetical protein
VPDNDPSRPILSEAEVTLRMGLLTDLQDALAVWGVQAVLARRRRLVLRANQPVTPSGPTDPQLHMFAPGGADVAATDGSTYRFGSGGEYPANDPAGAARATISPKLVQPRA